jgi:hypothetical protein
MSIAKWGLVILLILPLGTALARQQDQQQEQTPPRADQQQDSLAAASRRARAESKDQPKPAKVWDNDSIPTTTGNISVIGQAAAPPDNSPVADNSPAKPAPSAEKKSAALETELAAAKQQLESLKTDLDIMQRKYTLDDSMYRGKPDYTSDKAGAAAMKDEKDQVDAKLQEVADAQKRIDDLQVQLDAASAEKSK